MQFLYEINIKNLRFFILGIIVSFEEDLKMLQRG